MKHNGTQQPVVITRTIESAVLLLQRAGAQFKVISPDGVEYGDLIAAKKGRFKQKYPRGTLCAIYIPHIKDLKVGEVAQIPVGTFPAADVRGALAGWCCKKWGNGAFRTAITGDLVEVLRVS